MSHSQKPILQDPNYGKQTTGQKVAGQVTGTAYLSFFLYQLPAVFVGMIFSSVHPVLGLMVMAGGSLAGVVFWNRKRKANREAHGVVKADSGKPGVMASMRYGARMEAARAKDTMRGREARDMHEYDQQLREKDANRGRR